MIQSVNRALDILICISDNQGKPMTISEIAKKVSLNQSTCCHLVDTLLERGFLERVSRSSGYTLGVYSYIISRYKDYHHDITYNCAPIIQWLQKKTGFTVVFANLIHGEKFVITHADASNNSLKEKGGLYKGTLYNSATGRAMLATMSEKELRVLVNDVGLPKQNEWPEIQSLDKLLSEIKKLKENRITKVFVEDSSYICKIAVAFNSIKDERFAIGIDIKTNTKPTSDQMHNIEKSLLVAADEIIRRMKFENY